VQWTILDVLRWTQGRFAEHGIATARLDAEVLLAHVLERDRVALYTHFDQPLDASELARYRALIKRRLGGEPVAYLIGKREFRSLELSVDERVLIPRPETETVVEAALARLPKAGRLVDVGTGSGAIALAIKAARPDVRVLAIDLSPAAADVARANVSRLGLEVEVRVGDLLAQADGSFDVIVSNPPYIPSGELAALPPEVQREPRQALDGGPSGLEVVANLVTQARDRLPPGGALVVEVGAGQAAKVAHLFVAAGLREVSTLRDLAGVERVVTASAPSTKPTHADE
jgi:release factor glutamine methyltransferase